MKPWYLCRRHSSSIPQLRPSLLRPVHIIVSSGPSILRGLDPRATSSNVIRQHTATELDLGNKGCFLSLCISVAHKHMRSISRLVSESFCRRQTARDLPPVPRKRTAGEADWRIANITRSRNSKVQYRYTEAAGSLIIKPLPEQGDGWCSATLKNLCKALRH